MELNVEYQFGEEYLHEPCARVLRVWRGVGGEVKVQSIEGAEA